LIRYHLPMHKRILLLFLLVSFSYLMILFLMGGFSRLFESIGLNRGESLFIATLILFLSLALSGVNVPILELERECFVPSERFIVFFGIPYPIPEFKRERTVIAINLGGALIPILVSIYLLPFMLKEIGILPIILSLGFVSLVSFSVSRVIPGVGIVTPALVPPMSSALISSAFGEVAVPLAYFSGTMGTLIGADVMRLISEWSKINSPLVSIGGAGTFDGIYLTGVISIALVSFISP